MTKAILMTTIMAVMSVGVMGQTAYDGAVEYNKKKHDAFVIDYPYPPEAVENALIQRMEKLGYKSKAEKGLFNRDKGFIVHKGAFITEIQDKSMDYVFKVDRKSRREKDESVLYMIVINNNENVKSAFTADEVQRARSFLSDLQPDVESAHLEIQIRTQDDAVVKAEKKFKNLQDDQASLEKRIKDLQADLEKNLKDQETQQKEIENQRKLAEELKGKRKPIL